MKQSNTKWTIWLTFTWLSTVNSSTASCHLPSKLMEWNTDSTKYDHSGWNRSLNLQSMCLKVRGSPVRMWCCSKLFISASSYMLIAYLIFSVPLVLSLLMHFWCFIQYLDIQRHLYRFLGPYVVVKFLSMCVLASIWTVSLQMQHISKSLVAEQVKQHSHPVKRHNRWILAEMICMLWLKCHSWSVSLRLVERNFSVHCYWW